MKVTGTTLDVLLYTINPSRDRLYVGEISRCEVLQAALADDALRTYGKRGWLKSMAEQVATVEGKVENILAAGNATDLFNIRFRLEDADPYDRLVTADRHDIVWKRQRYTLAAASDEIRRQWQQRKGKTTPPLISAVTRKGTPAVTYDPFHKRLQADVLPLLEARYGKGNVTLEADYVDITINDGPRTILVEIKTSSNPRAAIREAIGQLLEYAYYRPQATTGSPALIVLAPARLDKAAEEYLERLRNDFNIPISYCSHSEGDPLPEALSSLNSADPYRCRPPFPRGNLRLACHGGRAGARSWNGTHAEYGMRQCAGSRTAFDVALIGYGATWTGKRPTMDVLGLAEISFRIPLGCSPRRG